MVTLSGITKNLDGDQEADNEIQQDNVPKPPFNKYWLYFEITYSRTHVFQILKIAGQEEKGKKE